MKLISHSATCGELYPRTSQMVQTTSRKLSNSSDGSKSTSREDSLVSSNWALPWKTTPWCKPHTRTHSLSGHDNICIIRARTNSPKRHEKINISDGKIIPSTRPPDCATQHYRKIIPDVSNDLRNIIRTLCQQRALVLRPSSLVLRPGVHFKMSKMFEIIFTGACLISMRAGAEDPRNSSFLGSAERQVRTRRSFLRVNCMEFAQEM